MTAEKTITLLSFGFLYGLPEQADTVLDVRGMSNPFYDPDLRALTGLDERVQNYVMRGEPDRAYFDAIVTLLQRRIALYERWDSPNRMPLIIAVGCTGGQHRSVSTVERLAAIFRSWGYAVTVRHRELERAQVGAETR